VVLSFTFRPFHAWRAEQSCRLEVSSVEQVTASLPQLNLIGFDSLLFDEKPIADTDNALCVLDLLVFLQGHPSVLPTRSEAKRESSKASDPSAKP
jgi:hypothetical protein